LFWIVELGLNSWLCASKPGGPSILI
jgi:hypothetical protein